MQLLAFPAYADLSLVAADAPADKPWEDPATVSYVRNGDGTSNTTIDAVVKYTNHSEAGDLQVIKKTPVLEAYIHKDTTSKSPSNDRGGSIGYEILIAPNLDPSGPVYNYGINAKASFGKSLQGIQNSDGTTEYADKNKDRETLIASGYYQPTKSGIPHPRAFTLFFEGTTGLYSDHNSGGTDKGSGRLSGCMASIGANLAPFGLESSENKIGNIGVVPLLKFSAQIERDFSSSGSRQSDTYKLYTAALSLAFAKVDRAGTGAIPSLSLTRTIGDDLLVGRPYQTKTELSLGLTF